MRNEIILKFLDSRLLMNFYSLNEDVILEDLSVLIGERYVLNFDIVKREIFPSDFKYRFGAALKGGDYVWDIVVERCMPVFVEYMTSDLNKSPSPKKGTFSHGWRPRVVKIYETLGDNFFDLFVELTQKSSGANLCIVMGSYTGKCSLTDVRNFFGFHDVQLFLMQDLKTVESMKFSDSLLDKMTQVLEEEESNISIVA